MKPNINFLRKVKNQGVYRSQHYTKKRGAVWSFTGGEATAKRHVAGGFVRPPERGPSLGFRAYYTLTEEGEAALAKAEGRT